MEDAENKYNMLDKRIHLNNVFTISLEFLGFVIYTPGESGLPHKYPSWSISFVDMNDGVFYFGNRQILLPMGTCLLIPPYERHYLHCPGPNNMRLIYFGFNFDFPCGRVDICEVNRIFSKLPITLIFNRMLSEMALMLSNNQTKEKLASFSPQMLEYVLKVYQVMSTHYEAEMNGVRMHKHYQLIEKVKSTLMQNLRENISLDDMASKLYLSPRYLADLFVKATGMSYTSYNKMLRMERACELLNMTTMSISEIADELGFCDIHYFSRKFKGYFGNSPSTVRNLYNTQQHLTP